MQLRLPGSAGAVRVLCHVWLRWAESGPGGEEEVDAFGAAAGVRVGEDASKAQVGAWMVHAGRNDLKEKVCSLLLFIKSLILLSMEKK